MPGIQVELDATDQLVDMMAAAAGFAVEPENSNPEATKLGTVVSNGLIPGVVSEISNFDPDTGNKVLGTGYRYIYNTRTGERVTVHRNSLTGPHDVRRRKHTDPAFPEWLGKPAFSDRPTGKPDRGMALCPLFPGVKTCNACGESHPAHHEGWVNRMPGVKPCYSAHLANEYEADRHLEKRHPTAYRMVRDARERELRNEELDIRRQELATQQELAKALISNTRPAATSAPVTRKRKPK